MDTECRIQVSLVSRIVDGIHEVLDSHLIIAVPDTTGNIILMNVRNLRNWLHSNHQQNTE